MRIDSALPMHIARAYAIKPTAPVQSTPQTREASNLVAGRVAGTVDFDATQTRERSDVLQLYNRAADRVEAAVAVQVGRALDVKG